jgi:hypothetical protein
MRRDTLESQTYRIRLRAASNCFRDNGFVLCFDCATLAGRGAGGGYLRKPL